MRINNLLKFFIGTACIAFLIFFYTGCGCSNNDNSKTHTQNTAAPATTEQAQSSTYSDSSDEPEINYFDLE